MLFSFYFNLNVFLFIKYRTVHPLIGLVILYQFLFQLTIFCYS
nr:MAG TPA: hypothetical protein [Caudoviricetes sp.]